MKVVLISTYSFHGAGAAARRLHEGLLHEGIDSHFLCLHHRDDSVPGIHVVPPIQRSLPQKIASRATGWLRSLTRSSSDAEAVSYEMFTSPYAEYELHRHPVLRDADVINLHWISNFLDTPSFFANVRTPIAWTLHDMNAFKGCFHYEDEEREHVGRVAAMDREYRRAKQQAYRSSSLACITAPSAWLTNASAESELLSGVAHRHIPNGIDTGLFRAHDRQLARDVLGIPASGRVLLFVSTTLENRRKGFDLLLEARQSMAASEGVTFVAVGSRPSEPVPGIHYLGAIHDERLMALAYSAADAFVIPSREDNLPNTMLESLACGTPVVGTPIGGILDVVRDGENGALAESLTSGAIRDAIGRALENAERFDRQQIRADAVARYSLPVQARRFIELFEEIA